MKFAHFVCISFAQYCKVTKMASQSRQEEIIFKTLARKVQDVPSKEDVMVVFEILSVKKDLTNAVSSVPDSLKYFLKTQLLRIGYIGGLDHDTCKCHLNQRAVKMSCWKTYTWRAGRFTL